MVSFRTFFCAIVLTGCSANVCAQPTSSALAAGSGSLTLGESTFGATGFTWTDGAPEGSYASFTFAFGDASIECLTGSELGSFRGPTSLASLVSERLVGSACQIVIEGSRIDWTGGTITLTKDELGGYAVRLDAAPTIVDDVTVELDGLTGVATFEAAGCPSSGGSWWL